MQQTVETSGSCNHCWSAWTTEPKRISIVNGTYRMEVAGYRLMRYCIKCGKEETNGG